MQVKLDDQVLFEIDDRMIKMFEHDIIDAIPDIKRRLQWVIEHYCDQVCVRLKDEWIEKFSNDPSIDSIPSNKAKFIDLIFSQKDYKNRAQREKENV